MSNSVNRRIFLGAAAAGVAAAGTSFAQEESGSRVVVGVMGTGGRGTSLAQTFQAQSNVQVAYCCDVDMARAERAAAAVAKASGNTPRAVQDFRRILDDRSVDVFVCAASNHWHAPASILACAAGKHVYVEKPCSHNPRENELIVAAARKHKRLVQMGNQRRTWPKVREAIEQVRTGAIGRAYFAQSYYLARRPTIGTGKEAPVPQGLNYELWEGPAPHRAYRTNFLHYNWHWFWHWGNGELGNNGVHMIDVMRWGLEVDYPNRVSSTGGRYRFQDDQETPDTNVVTFDFPGRKSIRWEGLSCNTMPDNKGFDVVFHGERGSLVIAGGNYKIYDQANKEIRSERGEAGDVSHIVNFLQAVRGQGRLNSEIEEAAKSTLLCHLGNISYRTSKTLNCDSKNGTVPGDKEVAALWRREYAQGWEPRV